jgi:salicylate hydroxylase
MEDGALLSHVLQHVLSPKPTLTLPEAIQFYEKARLPKAFQTQQISFMKGAFWQFPEGELQKVRHTHPLSFPPLLYHF